MRDDRAPRSDRPVREDRPSRPWQDRSAAPDSRGPARAYGDRPERGSAPERANRPDRGERPAWRDKPAADRRPAGERPSSAWADREAPRFERREPDRGSRVREDEIGERWPEIPEWADPRELDAEVRRDLRGLSKEGSEFVGAHLFMAGMLAEEDPALAWRHARAARSKGGRIAVVRETVGLVAYHAGEWAEAIAELRAARRMSGGPGQLPVIADCERALGHPEKAIELSRSAEAADLDPASAAELRIVVAGARADLGQLDAAIASLETAVNSDKVEPFSARLFYAYADLLLQAGRRDEAINYFMRAAEIDVDEETDAGDRLTELAGGDVVTDEDLSDEEALDGELDADLIDPADQGQSAESGDDSSGDATSGSVSDVDEGTQTSVAGAGASGIGVRHMEGSETAGTDAAGFEAAADEAAADETDGDEDGDVSDVDGAGAPDYSDVDFDAEDPDAQEIVDQASSAVQVDDEQPNDALDESIEREKLPERPASRPSGLGSLFSHDEGGR
ncbi:Tetratricopeptide repeat-containing protein [Nakamurella panacisegetis]|uniref:Tetratricopeptide repeat-containing protein n=1 Tax=Nakamurella panacisegetis TaxID=1090615 RepID=A0A1H0PQV4_9ACTN|nr:tetratricopeptide repeat protein [Nakamurella panacisegetis]SDP07364.1 Tetratricopeptide repeat-containing protein [Nakamurella panacisegetis]